MLSRDDLIRLLSLEPLPVEGGFFRETYRSAYSTAIYYLLTPDTYSAIHRLPSAEVFHFYYGDPVQMLLLPQDGDARVVLLGNDPDGVFNPQVVVPAGVWQGSCLAEGGRLALLGTTVSPAFEFSDLEPGDAALLSSLFPRQRDLIQRLAPRT